jgi:hypothetical protein
LTASLAGRQPQTRAATETTCTRALTWARDPPAKKPRGDGGAAHLVSWGFNPLGVRLHAEPFGGLEPSKTSDIRRLRRRASMIFTKRAFSLGSVILCCGLVACGGKKRPADEPGPKKQEEISDSEVERYLEESRVGIDEEAAKIALDRGGRKVAQCGESSDAPVSSGDVTVVFDGTKGRVTEVELGMGWPSSLSERAQDCIKNAFLGEIVPPFEGEERKVYSVEIPEKAPEGKK